MSEAIAAVVFDLDGVLVDSESVWDAARREVVARNGGRWQADATRAMMGMNPAAVEDSTNGLRAAAAAGMVLIARPNRGYPPEPDALALAALVVESLDELTAGRDRACGAAST